MVNKYQLDSLIYQPIKSITKQQVEEEKPVNEFLGPVEETPFPVEPVREWIQPKDFDWKSTVDSSNDHIVENTPGTGKIYKPSERDIFKTELLNAYVEELKNRGFNDEDSLAYAKRIVAQDALESRYGQSGLSKYYNFGGIKDFRENSDSVKVDTKEFENGKMKVKKQPFRKFKDLKEYVNYKLDLLGNSNFDVFSYNPDIMYARLMSAKRKYATDPDYEKKLNNIYWLLWR